MARLVDRRMSTSKDRDSIFADPTVRHRGWDRRFLFVGPRMSWKDAPTSPMGPGFFFVATVAHLADATALVLVRRSPPSSRWDRGTSRMGPRMSSDRRVSTSQELRFRDIADPTVGYRTSRDRLIAALGARFPAWSGHPGCGEWEPGLPREHAPIARTALDLHGAADVTRGGLAVGARSTSMPLSAQGTLPLATSTSLRRPIACSARSARGAALLLVALCPPRLPRRPAAPRWPTPHDPARRLGLLPFPHPARRCPRPPRPPSRSLRVRPAPRPPPRAPPRPRRPRRLPRLHRDDPPASTGSAEDRTPRGHLPHRPAPRVRVARARPVCHRKIRGDWQEGGDRREAGRARGVRGRAPPQARSRRSSEQAAGNEFSARVFPIPRSRPQGARHRVEPRSSRATRAVRASRSAASTPMVDGLDVAVESRGRRRRACRRALVREAWMPAADFVVPAPRGGGTPTACAAGTSPCCACRPVVDGPTPIRCGPPIVLFDSSASRAPRLRRPDPSASASVAERLGTESPPHGGVLHRPDRGGGLRRRGRGSSASAGAGAHPAQARRPRRLRIWGGRSAVGAGARTGGRRDARRADERRRGDGGVPPSGTRWDPRCARSRRRGGWSGSDAVAVGGIRRGPQHSAR